MENLPIKFVSNLQKVWLVLTKKVNKLLETLLDKNIASALNIVWVWKSPFSMALRCSDISNKEDFLIFKCCSLLGFMMYIVSKTCRAAFCRDRAMTFWQQWKQPLVIRPLKWEESGLLKPIWHFLREFNSWRQRMFTMRPLTKFLSFVCFSLKAWLNSNW